MKSQAQNLKWNDWELGSNIWRHKELGINPEADVDVQILKANDE